MAKRVLRRVGILTAVLVAVIGGCSGDRTSQPLLERSIEAVLNLPGQMLVGSQPNDTSRRPVSGEGPGPAGTPSVKDFLAVCDLMARDLVMSNVVQSAKEAVVVEIRPIDNKTDAKIDLTIYPQTIRGIILKSGSNRVVFRDETARSDILAERSHQTDDAVSVDFESNLDTTHTVGDSAAPAARSQSEVSKTKVKKSSEVSGRIAETDYFLKGFIYAVNETDGGVMPKGYRYFRFQFRLTDARSGLVVWENDYEVKKQGAFGPPA
jgi:PBP1b-binding outer membrane lipoprotein LpoB